MAAQVMWLWIGLSYLGLTVVMETITYVLTRSKEPLPRTAVGWFERACA